MSSYTAIIRCEKCGEVLATIKSAHHGRADIFVPQDIHEVTIDAEWIYCDNCLNEEVKDETN